MVYSQVVSFSCEVLELYFQVRAFLSIWTSCKYRETWGRELSSSASNYTNLEKHRTGQGAVSSKYYLGQIHIHKLDGNMLIFIEKIESYPRRPTLTQGLTLGTRGVTLGGIGLGLFRMEW